MAKFIETKDMKLYKSHDFNYGFNKQTGATFTYGVNKEHNPEVAPFPLIADIEITERCSGPGDGPCKFCFPADVEISMANGTSKTIDKISVGDDVVSFNENTDTFTHNSVEEIYERPYSGVLICIELEDGTELKMTPEHPVYVTEIGWVEAKDLNSDMEVVRY